MSDDSGRLLSTDRPLAATAFDGPLKRDYIAIHCFLGEFDHVLKHRVSHRISCVPVHGDGPIIAVYGDWFGERSISPISPSTDSLSIIRSRTFRSETVTGTT